MNREAVADRILTYSDALVAFSLVNGLGFLIALGDPELRCSIAGIAGTVIAINFAIPVGLSSVLVWLRNFEQRLRGEQEDEVIRRFWKVAGIARFVLIWFFSFVVMIGVFAASLDVTCERMVQ